MTEPAPFARRHGRSATLVVVPAILLVALAVRIIGLRAGLPGSGLLSPDEDTVVPKALAMAHDGTLNPHWYLYPTLYLTLLAGTIRAAGPLWHTPPGLDLADASAYAVDATPYIMTGRILSLVAGLAAVYGVWLLGRRLAGRAGGLIAAGLAAIAPVMVAYSHIAVTDMTMTALLTFALWQMTVAVQDRSRRAIRWAALLIGLAASAKYNAGFAAIPLLVAAWWCREPEQPRRTSALRLLEPALISVGAFVAGTPYAVIDAPTFVSDFIRQNRIVADGWLGFEGSGPGWLVNLHPVLWNAVGGGTLLLAGLGVVVVARRRDRAAALLAAYAIGYTAYVSAWNAHFDRYLLPIVPVVFGLVAIALLATGPIARRAGGTAAAAATASVALACWVTTFWGTAELLDRYRTPDGRLALADRLTRILPDGVRVAIDPLGPPVIDAATARRLATVGIRRRGYELVRLATPQPGRPSDPMRNVSVLRERGVEWVVTSDDVERRVRRAGTRYPAEVSFYDAVRTRGTLVASAPDGVWPGARLWRITGGDR